ncbi:arsenate reductase (glutaredoxin) [Celeribacter ethanolicus]|uniref:Arsenate reductase n=1 Tax=Celeribacter ethanolicus TaxID=1758178 RepID=A0A291GA42_9RHOB|nr:arsenate reductase (glutaredoxin) [Celeribacter ethanolicus]ATG47279.1 arsenate reductase (glutaredoxin) [Celeribacter ethanolicus]TNE64865.1 MAG: arsenate reductase (glutaredoxin) [Paracoccaceae bacterium]
MTRIYHNPRCSKSRETLKLIEAAGISPEVVLYLETPVSREKLAELVAHSGLPVSAFLRAKEAEAKELGITASSDPEAILDAIAAHPRLMERPVVESDKGVALGRPPEAVKAVL